MNDLTVIGSTELIDLPKYGIFNVPAKTDTGADSSSIWASDIRDITDGIYFKLFDETSEFYTGEDVFIPKKSVKTQVVINSFGHKEERYKIKLPISVKGRKVRASITLANRENNRYPVLLGRRLLANKFIVDVRHKAVDLKKQEIKPGEN